MTFQVHYEIQTNHRRTGVGGTTKKIYRSSYFHLLKYNSSISMNGEHFFRLWMFLSSIFTNSLAFQWPTVEPQGLAFLRFVWNWAFAMKFWHGGSISTYIWWTVEGRKCHSKCGGSLQRKFNLPLSKLTKLSRHAKLTRFSHTSNHSGRWMQAYRFHRKAIILLVCI